MNKKITLFNQVSGPLFIDIANTFSEEYDEVVLVTGNLEPTYARLDKNIKVVKKVKYKRNKTYLRLITWLIFFVQSFFYILRNNNHGKILLVTNPPLLPFLGLFFSKKKMLHFSILVYDIYPDALLNFGYLKKSSKVYKLWFSLNKKSYKLSSEIITISNVMKNILANSVDEDKIKVIYPWVDNSFIKPVNRNDNWFLKKYGLLNKKVILYSGNMGITHDLMTILKAAKDLQEITNYFHFLFIGDGPQKQKLIKYQKINKLLNVSFLPYQDSEVLPFSFASADFGIVSLGTGAEGLSIPSKTFYLLSAGSVIIAISESGSEIDKLVIDNRCGISVQPKDSKKLVDFLLHSNDKTVNFYKVNSRLLSEKFTIKNAKKFL